MPFFSSGYPSRNILCFSLIFTHFKCTLLVSQIPQFPRQSRIGVSASEFQSKFSFPQS